MSTTDLSARELEVLRAIARHGSERAAADVLGIAYHTAKAHRQNAYRKLDAGSAREAWIALGWMRPPDAS